MLVVFEDRVITMPRKYASGISDVLSASVMRGASCGNGVSGTPATMPCEKGTGRYGEFECCPWPPLIIGRLITCKPSRIVSSARSYSPFANQVSVTGGSVASLLSNRGDCGRFL